MPNEGYTFDHWEIGGNFVSNEIEYTFEPTAAATIKAVFVPEVSEQRNPYRATIMAYDIGTGSIYDSYKSASYVTILKGDVNEDLLQRSTSTFECMDIPSAVQINTPIFLYDPKGRVLYYGAVKAIEGNTLTCREPISLYDDEYLLQTSKYQSDYTTAQFVYEILNSPGPYDGFSFASEKKTDIYALEPDKNMPFDTTQISTKVMPLIDTNKVVNMEDTLLNAYSELGVLIEYSFYPYLDNPYDETKFFMSAKPTMNRYEKLTISDNSEFISNISVNIQEADATVLTIYNS